MKKLIRAETGLRVFGYDAYAVPACSPMYRTMREPEAGLATTAGIAVPYCREKVIEGASMTTISIKLDGQIPGQHLPITDMHSACHQGMARAESGM